MTSIEDEFGEELGGDPAESGGSNDGYDDGSSGGSSSGGFFSLGTTLTALKNNPQRFVIGAIAVSILEWLFGIVNVLIDTILLILGGSEPSTFDAPGETLGIADIPVRIANELGGVGDTVGSAIIEGIQSFNEPIFAGASFAGPASPLIVTFVVVLETVAVLWLAQRAVFVAADLLQLGGLTE